MQTFHVIPPLSRLCNFDKGKRTTAELRGGANQSTLRRTKLVEKHAPAGRVGKVLPSCGSTGDHHSVAALPLTEPYKQISHIRLFNPHSGPTVYAFSPIRVRSLAICFLPLRVADVCPPASERCEGLHSTGITRLHRARSRA